MTAGRLQVSVISAASLDSPPSAPIVVRSNLSGQLLPSRGQELVADSLDDLWTQPLSTSPNWRDTLLERLHGASSGSRVTYIVPGDPLLADATVSHLIALRTEGLIELEILDASRSESLSYVLSLAPGPVAFIDALTLREISQRAPFAGGSFPINSNLTTIVTNVVGDAVDELGEALSRQFGTDIDVTLVPMLGRPEASSRTLRELGRFPVSQCQFLVVPPATGDRFYRTSDDLQRLVARLRAPDGCPWDREQTNQSLTKNLIEESYELLDAIDSGQPNAIREELGDFVLQAYLHCQIADEADLFRLEDVLESLISKLVRRHPHVFAAGIADDSEAVVQSWDEIKRVEQQEKNGADNGRPLGNVPIALPALLRAQTLLKRARRTGMKPEDLEAHRRVAVDSSSADPSQAEVLGNLLAVVEQASAAGVDLEEALRDWTRTFEQSATGEPSPHSES